MDINPLRQAYRELLQTAGTVTESGHATPPAGEWDADQILAHISILTCITLAAVTTIASGVHTTYDNRIAQDTWTIEHIIRLTGGGAGLRTRIRTQAGSRPPSCPATPGSWRACWRQHPPNFTGRGQR